MKNTFLLSTLAVLLAAIGFGGVSFADNLVWDYIHDEESWQAAYDESGSVLKMYYEDYPSEDLYCTDHTPTFNNREYTAQICSDSNCTDPIDIVFTTTWGENYQTVVGGGKTYYLTMAAEPGNTIYELYEDGQASCVYPNNISGAYFPNGWSGFDVCKYAVQFSTTTSGKCLNELPEGAPAGASIPKWALNLTGTSAANPDWPTGDGKCLYEAKATPQPTNYVKILSYSYPGCVPSGKGWLANGGVAWGAIHFPYAYTGRIGVSYSGYNEGENIYVDEGHSWNIKKGKYFIFSIPAVIRAGFEKENLSINLEWECENGYHQEGNACIVDAPAPVSTPSGGSGGGSRSGTTKVSGDSSSTSQTDKTDSKSDDKSDDTSDEKTDENTEDKTEEQVEEKTEDTNLEEDTQTTQEETPIASQEELQNYEEQSRYDNKGDQQEVLDDGLTREMNNAYEFSHRAGITSMNNASEADMFGPLNRIAMAKMLVNYATNVLGRKPDTSKPVPAFVDVDASLEADYGNAVTMAYQLGIMGIGITDFRPFDEVPRGEFGTALSRMLFGLADGQGAYYETHLQKLANEGIIRDSNPDLQELRGYVMIMLMRSAKK